MRTFGIASCTAIIGLIVWGFFSFFATLNAQENAPLIGVEVYQSGALVAKKLFADVKNAETFGHQSAEWGGTVKYIACKTTAGGYIVDVN